MCPVVEGGLIPSACVERLPPKAVEANYRVVCAQAAGIKPGVDELAAADFQLQEISGVFVDKRRKDRDVRHQPSAGKRLLRRLLTRLGDLPEDHLALQAGEVVDEEHALEMVHL